ncbi:MAG: enoyl-CoA hydratase [Alphaproteobacteria bacterium]|nr:enoyl-CoA hydratase [Alphaproteobacteria bacterium]
MTSAEQLAETTDEPVLLRDDADGVSTLTLNRPKSGNSLSHALVAALQSTLEDIAGDPSVRVVVFAASGKHFCTGHDLKESLATKTGADKAASNHACNVMMQTIVELPQPVIARVHGTATASGCELASSCDLIVASDVARFATPGVNIGFWCYTPQVALSRVVSRKQALEMLLTGDLIDAQEALRIGLVNRVVPLADLDAAVGGLAAKIASKSSEAVARGKQSFYRQYEMTRSGAYDYVTKDVIPEAFEADDAREGIAAFVEKRPPAWKGR